MMNTTIMSPINYKVESEKQKFGLRLFLSTIIFVSTALFIGSALVILDRKQFSEWASNDAVKGKIFKPCDETQHRPHGSEPLPRGIVSPTSDLELLPLWGLRKKNLKKERNLLAIAVGIKQKENVNKIVNKFLSSDRNFVVMLFHYDGLVDGWRDFEWSHKAIHISAINQTKWWFGKRFLHPDIVSEYEYIFLWDEDLGVDNFDPGRYLSIIKEEGVQISQPALDPNRSEVHHHLTKRQYGSRVHRRIAGKIGGTMCNENAAGPPCSGFVEMMAPVFSKASWRCTWYMIQNDLVQGWGLDFHLGYCAQGDRSKNVGIVDSQYIVHYGLPTLGGSETKAQLLLRQSQDRQTVKQWSLVELEIFKNRWKKAAKDDDCWADPYKQS